MSLNIFNKMLARFTALAISVLYFQVSCSHQNGSNILSNLVLNNSVGIQSQGNIIQKSLNQFATNRVLPSNLQQNLQKSQNIQFQGPQQGANVQQLVNLQTFNSQQQSNQQPVSTQHPINLQSVTTQQPMLIQSANTQQSRHFQTGNPQQTSSIQSGTTQQPLNLQQPLNIQPAGNLQQFLSRQQSINIQQTSLPNRNSVQQNINAHNQNPTLNNVQMLRQGSDVSSPPRSSQYVQSCQGANALSSSVVTPAPPGSTTTLCINNSGGESMSVMYPPNQQVSISGVPSYVIDSSQISNTVQAPIAYSTTQGNQPALLTVLAVPQQNHQQIEILQSPLKGVQNPTENPNQITIIKSVQPHSSAASTINHDLNQISVSSPVTNQLSPSSYPTMLPTVSSILASTLSNQASKSTNLKALLPLIFNLIKEKNSCGCNRHCGCSNNTPNPYENEGERYRSYPKQPKYGYKQYSKINDYSDEFEDHGRYENRRNSKKYGKHKKAKPESVETSKEYDYSDEFHEDDY